MSICLYLRVGCFCMWIGVSNCLSGYCICISMVCFLNEYCNRAFSLPCGSSAEHICWSVSHVSLGVMCWLNRSYVATAYWPCNLSIQVTSLGVASMRIISIPNIGITLITTKESRTACIVILALSLLSPISTVPCALRMTHVCHVGVLSAGRVGPTIFFVPHPARTISATM